MSRKTKADLVAENTALAEALAKALATNGHAPAPGVDPELVNYAGVVCSKPFLAWSSSTNMVNHLHGTCKCSKGQPARCTAFTRYDGYDASNFGSDPDAAIPAPVQAQHDAYLAAKAAR